MGYAQIAKRETPPPDRLRELAYQVRRIGCGFRADPETIAIQKDEIAADLAQLARDLEASR